MDGGFSYVQTRQLTAESYLSLWVDPTNPNHVLVGHDQLSRSVDGGMTFSGVPLTFSAAVQPPRNAGSGAFAIATESGFGASSSRVYVATREGVAVTANLDTTPTAGWQALNTGLSNGEVAGADGASATGAIVARLRLAGVVRFTPEAGPNGWTVPQRFLLGSANFDNVSEAVVVDPVDPSHVYVQQSNGGALRSLDGGQTFAMLSGGAAWAWRCNGDPNVLVVTATKVERTRNARAPSPSFTTILPETFFSHIPLTITDFTFAPSRPETAWVARSGRTLLRSDNVLADEPAWTSMSYPGTVTSNQPNVRVTIDPASPGTVYLANASPELDGLYRTFDGGATWSDLSGTTSSDLAQDIAGQLPPWQGVSDLAIHPDRATWLYAATDAGVYASEDDGATWTFAGPTRARVRELFWMAGARRDDGRPRALPSTSDRAARTDADRFPGSGARATSHAR